MFAARSLLALGLAAAVLLLGGCGDLDDTAAAQGIDHNDLVSELAAQLSDSATLTYSADYQLAGGSTASVRQAQNPPQTAYGYPGGEILVTDEAVTHCAGAKIQTCTVTAPPAAPSALPAQLSTTAQRTGMIDPRTVLTLLNSAALSQDVTVEPRDTTIAGHHATCLNLAGVDDPRARSFSTCVTSDGVLGSFTGALDGTPIDMAMTQFSTRVPADAFEPPANARTVDRRTTR